MQNSGAEFLILLTDSFQKKFKDYSRPTQSLKSNVQ